MSDWQAEESIVAEKRYVAYKNFVVVAGQKLKVMNHNEKVVEETAPAGKVWAVELTAKVVERDA